MRAYFQKHFCLTQDQVNLVDGALDGLSQHSYWFFYHLLKSTLHQVRQHRGWIPISSTLIKTQLPEANIRQLEELGLIEIKNHDRYLKKMREYRISLDFLTAYINASPLISLTQNSVEEYLATRKINAFSKKTFSPFMKSQLYDTQRHPEPNLIIEAINSIDYSLYNQYNTLKHLTTLRNSYLKLKKEESPLFEHQFYDFLLDFQCFESILNQKPMPTTNEKLYSFKPAYKVQSTGRIEAIGGGLQNCSKKMKLAAFDGIDDLEIIDLSASHANILLNQMQMANIACSWLEDYLASPQSKYAYASSIGIRYSTWKRCFYAFLMGARLNPSMYSPANPLRGYLALDIQSKHIDEAYKHFIHIIQPLREPLNEWYKYLLDDYVPRYSTQVLGKTYIKNPAGKVKLLTTTTSKAQIAAFIIQGYETAFIHQLTILSKKYNYIPINNEHDGLYVLGHVSQQAIVEARAKTGLRFLQVNQKTLNSSA